jgi:hypothetical protein
MNETERRKILSNDYANVITEYAINPEELARFENDTINYIDDKYAVIYIPIEKVPQFLIGPVAYSVIPKTYGLLDEAALEEMGVSRVQATPFLSLKGQNILLGFVDTGIDYSRSIFKYSDNKTRIVSIWDQTIENLQASESTYYFGTAYTRDQIDLALQNADPLSVVPSIDEIGHGTTLAGLAGGSYDADNDFTGVVPLSEFVIVKLKTAKPRLKEFFGIPEDVPCFSEDDIMFGIRYLYLTAKKLQRPIAICIGIGTNQGGHEGLGVLNDMITRLGTQAGTAFVLAGGNEGNRAHHYSGSIDKSIGYDTVELIVGEGEHDFSMELWGNTPGSYSVDITSPSGEYYSRIPARVGEHRLVEFIFETTKIYIDYVLVESQSGDQLILMRFQSPTPGIWRFRVYGSKINSGFHIWLPIYGFITENTFFLKPDPYTIITNPGNNPFAITATAYDYRNNSIFINASRGYTRNNLVKPDFAVPGVAVYSPLPGNTFGTTSGTSTAAALLTGVTAMLLEWGIVKGNDRSMDSLQISKYLIRGVDRTETITYPNREWGYGMVDIYSTFESLSGES